MFSWQNERLTKYVLGECTSYLFVLHADGTIFYMGETKPILAVEIPESGH